MLDFVWCRSHAGDSLGVSWLARQEVVVEGYEETFVTATCAKVGGSQNRPKHPYPPSVFFFFFSILVDLRSQVHYRPDLFV